MTVFESAEETISRDRALEELKNHGIHDPKFFFLDLGDFEAYEVVDVLEWLSY